MTKLIRLPEVGYINLENATSFSIEKQYDIREVPCTRRFLWWKFEDFKIAKVPVYIFVVNGQVMYEADEDNAEEMRIINNIQSCITGFIRKK